MLATSRSYSSTGRWLLRYSPNTAERSEVIDRLGDVFPATDEIECGEQLLRLLTSGLTLKILVQIVIGADVVVNCNVGVCPRC